MHGHFYLGRAQRALGRGKVSAGGHPWPRAGRPDLAAARSALGAFDPARALEALGRAADAVAARLPALLERRLGLEPDHARRAAGWVAGLELAPDPGHGRRRRPGGGPGPRQGGEPRRGAEEARGPVVLVGHWTQLGDRPARALAEAFRHGRPVLWLGDEHLPEVPQAWVEALADAQLDPRALALLHAPDPALREELPDGVGGVRPAAARLGPELDVELAAAHCASAAFEDLPALGGRRAGSLRRVVCDPRRFSALTEALAAELDAFGDLLPPLDRGARRALEVAVERALERGGTPVRGARGGWEPALVVHAEPQPMPEESVVEAASVPLLELERAPLGGA